MTSIFHVIELVLLLVILREVRRPLRMMSQPLDQPLLGRVESPVSHAPIMLVLQDRQQQVRYTVTVHDEKALESYTYAGITYWRLHQLESGEHIYRER